MSLLDRAHEDILVFPEETTVDSDGNIMTRPSQTGIPARAVIQMLAQSGTSARRSEQDNEGFESEEVYRLRFPRSFPYVLSAQARIEWRGQYWAIVGEARRYNGSARTRHMDYTIRRT
ncbi:hypothetical protein [Actinocrispum wychmicini]|uniref:Head-to-tail stopper n=1 Tax=Actinocrispum wychmicini TaxID=1213861 RepID=A0A4R2JRU7_9PSEU|nr:hypothetical protein [Actinocrispum wychmicini]TCO56905.1 hypothetical protein EV192_106380 [Actinocrispum wychmicini]